MSKPEQEIVVWAVRNGPLDDNHVGNDAKPTPTGDDQRLLMGKTWAG